ncbi:MAG TPA: hypothetical protein VM889_11310 [Candidatus Thermoplasmatota archaeon]|nr:hypothetical protein [Candidatus Thermoplasmatota archaeon]
MIHASPLSRRVALVAAPVLLALLVLAAPAGAQVAPSDRWQFESVPHDTFEYEWTDCKGRTETYGLASAVWNDVAYNPAPKDPNDPEALLVGGFPGCEADPAGGFAVVALVNRTGVHKVHVESPASTLYKVSWEPSGRYAVIVGAYDKIMKYKDGVVKDIFTDSEFFNITVRSASAHFHGRDVKFKPNGQYAMITGTDIILAYNESDGLKPIFIPSKIPGVKESYLLKTVGWAPNSSFAFVSGARKHANNTIELGSLMLWSEESWKCSQYKLSAPCMVYLFPYGRFTPWLTDINGITFEPNGRTAWIVGFEANLKGTVLKWCHGGCTRNGHEFQWHPYTHPSDLKGVAWQPSGNRGLMIGLESNFTLNMEANAITPILDKDLCRQVLPPRPWLNNTTIPRSCGRFHGVAWSPNGLEALIVGQGNRDISQVLRYTLNVTPTLTVTTPVEGQVYRSEVLAFTGVANAFAPNRPVNKVEYAIDDGAWREAFVFPAGHVTTWFVSWNATADNATYGNHTLRLRGHDGVSSTAVKSVRFQLREALAALPAPALASARDLGTGLEVNATKGGFFNLTWSLVEGATLYEVQETTANTDTGWALAAREFRASPPFDVFCRAKGHYWFRVVARGEAPASMPSNVVGVNVTEGCTSSSTTKPPIDPNPTTPTKPTGPTGPSTILLPGNNTNETPPPDVKPPKTGIPGFEVLALVAAIAVLVGVGPRRQAKR